MSEITFDIPGDKMEEVLDNFCSYYGYEAGTETKQQFFRRKTIGFWKNAIACYKLNKAAEDARQAELVKPTVEIT